MKITCPNCETSFAVGIDDMGPKGRKLKCSSCKHVWRQFDEDVKDEPTADKATDSKPAIADDKKQPKKNDQSDIDDMFAVSADDGNEENDQGAIDDMFASTGEDDDDTDGNEENDQGAIDDMFATADEDDDDADGNEENDQGAIDDMFATADEDDDDADGNEENDQGAIDDMFATADEDDGNEENDQGAIDDMFATADEDDGNEENDQGAIDDMFATADEDDGNEENDQGAIDDMFDVPLTADEDKKLETVELKGSAKEEFEKALPSQSTLYKKRGRRDGQSGYIYWSALAFAASLIFGVFIIGKNTIIDYFPKSAATYQLYGFETNTVGLEFVNISVRHQTQDGIEFLLVNGSIMNNSNSTKALPKVRGYLVDRDNNNIFNWPIPIAKTSLAAGEIVSFKSGMKDPATSAQKVKFQFILDKKLADK